MRQGEAPCTVPVALRLLEHSDIEIKNKLTVTRGKAGGDNGRTKGKGGQGTCVKDTWTKPKGVG